MTKLNRYRNKKHPIVTLCGSTKFKKQFYDYNESLTHLGYIVLMPGVFGHADSDNLWTKYMDDEQKRKLDELHKLKITLSDMVIVLNFDNYIGESTKSEIEWAERIGVPVFYAYSGPIEPEKVKEYLN